MRFRSILASALVVIVTGVATAAGPERSDLEQVVKSLRGVPVDDSAVYLGAEDHYLKYISAPVGTGFEGSSTAKALGPEQAARGYLSEHMKAFGSNSVRQGFSRDRVNVQGDRSYVRLNQTYDGIPVFGAQVNAQIGATGQIESLLSNIMRDTRLLDNGGVSTTPRLSASAASQAALQFGMGLYVGSILSVQDDPQLFVYQPSVVGNTGPTRLVWLVVVGSTGLPPVEEAVFIDAATGEAVFHYNRIQNIKFRRIYDIHNAFNYFGYLRRQEGQSSTGIVDVDRAYDFLGDTYDFYYTYHGRDSIDGAGMPLNATVRMNWENASWNPEDRWIFFGENWALDDVAAHELTHGVTSSTSDLLYFNESGAINESFSDIWGEYVDLVNHKGTDTNSVRWLVGEDLLYGAIRSMKNPEQFLIWGGLPTPDRYSRYVDLGFQDNGGVHYNSGIGNKLAYLMTDGDTFNGYTIEGIDIAKTAALFYEAQTNLMTRNSNYIDLGLQLVRAAYNFDYTRDEIETVRSATRAVEIAPPETVHNLRHFRARSLNGQAKVWLTWDNPYPKDSTPVRIIRRTDRFPTGPSDTQPGNVWSQSSTKQSYDDASVTLNQSYFYGAFFNSPIYGLQTDFARVTAGVDDTNFLTQAFSKSAGRPVDIANTQFDFEPTYDHSTAVLSGQPSGYVNYSSYTTKITKGVSQLPVDDEGSMRITMEDDGIVIMNTEAPIPFFGRSTTTFALAANGYVADLVDYVDEWYAAYTNDFNFPSLETHYTFPRISFLFSDLSPHSGGMVWVKYLDDRVAVTFERVPQFGSNLTNTAQLEMFFSGRIRITLLEVNAVDAIVGLSDGNGIPYDAQGKSVQSDLSTLPTAQPGSLSIVPVPWQWVEEQDTLSFTMTANAPAGADPVFQFARVDATGAPMELPAGVEVTPVSGTAARSAEFTWTPTMDQNGYYIFRVTFALGDQKVSQDIQVIVANVHMAPTIEPGPAIVPNIPQDSEMLYVDYTYNQVQSAPEGATAIRWLKNGVLVPGFTNRREVPASATTENDTWQVLVTPVSINGVEGQTYASPIVTIGPDIIPDISKDGLVNALDIQLVINAVLKQDDDALGADVDGDYLVNARDVQWVINTVIAHR